MEELGTVVSGCLDPRSYRDKPFLGALPALRAGDVGRLGTPRWWAEAENQDVAQPGSILVGALSLRVDIARERLAVARDIFVFSANARPPLSAEEVRERIVGYLSSPAGQKRLKEHAIGAASARLPLKAFAAFRVPEPASLPSRRPQAAELLATRLERLLWS